MTPKINWSPSDKDLKKFGWTIFIGFGVIGALLLWRGKITAASIAWAVSSVVLILSVTIPSLARPFYWLWMGFGFVMGSIMSRIIMGLIFFFVVTPVALFFKITGRDALSIKKRPADSYWNEHPKISDPTYYEHMS